MSDFKVVIVGGGFVGAIAALALSRYAPRDFTIGVVERSSFAALAAQKGRAYALSESSRILFSSLGLWDQMADDAQPVSEIDVTDSELDAEYRPVFLNFFGEVSPGQSAAYIIEHEVLAGPIYGALQSAPNIELIENDGVANISNDPGGVMIGLKSGASHHSRLIIGADGRSSRIRELAGIKVVHSDYKQDGIVVTVKLSQPHEGKAVQHFLPSGPFAILPLTGDRASLVWTERRDLASKMCELDDAAFIEEVNKRFTSELGEVTLAGERANFPLSLSVARSFIGDRIALIGDAAHGVHPLAGQGMNIGLRDVAALAEIVLETEQLGLDIGDATTLERYQQWRRFDGVMSAFAMDGLNRLFSNDNALLREVRGIGLRLVERVPPLKAFFVSEAAGLNGDVPRLMKGEPI